MRLLFTTIPLILMTGVSPSHAQGTKTDYERAAQLPASTAGRVFRDRVQPHWHPQGESFWYQLNTPEGTKEIWEITTATGAKKSLASAPTTTPTTNQKNEPRPSRPEGAATTLNIENHRPEPVQVYWINPDGQWHNQGGIRPGASHTQPTRAGHVFIVIGPAGEKIATIEAETTATTLVLNTFSQPPQAGETTPADSPAPAPAPAPRPFSARIDGHALVITPQAGGAPLAPGADGTAENAYREPVVWSPQGTRLACLRVRPAPTRTIHLLESSPRDQLQPKLRTLDYAKPGDVIDQPHIALINLDTQESIPVDNSLFSNPWSIEDMRWSPDGRELSFLYNQRGHAVMRWLAVDGTTGAVRTVIEETSRTFIDYTNKIWHQWLDDTGEIIWMSERDGWNHLYLIDFQFGTTKNQITRGSWVVRRVEHVDPVNRQIWFAAMGVRPEQSPYHVHLCRINFDGTGLVILTAGDGTHTWEFAPGRATFLDRWSRVDQPAVTELRRSTDGSLVCEVERGDDAALLATGWRAPERFVAKGRDQTTDIHGIILRPTHFDPSKKYPVIEKIYAGPQDHFVPQTFSLMTRDRQIGELGFIMVQIDGMGTNWRHKSFHDVCWKNLHDAGFPDRIAWLKAAAARFPELDLERVGIYGGSAGGQSAMRALIDHGDFYRAAAADCGCHDNRMDKIWWNEQWMGWPVDASYEAASNAVQASRLQGSLMLTVGELDSNVDPASTLQVVDALVAAGKDFEFLMVPGGGHGVGETPYPARRRMDFFVRHLWRAEPRR